MESEDLNKTILFLTTIQNNHYLDDEIKNIHNLCIELEKIKTKLPTEKELNELQKNVIDLEVKYDVLNELSYYFDPLYEEIKNKIQKKKIKKIREENKRKRVKN